MKNIKEEEFVELVTPQLVLERRDKCEFQTSLSFWYHITQKEHKSVNPRAQTLDHDALSLSLDSRYTQLIFIINTCKIHAQSPLYSFKD